MSSEYAVEVEQLGKAYQIYGRPSDRLRQFVFPSLHKALGLPVKSYHRAFWAVADVSFKIRRGETVGIVGRNGSGKSTLLQMICGTLTPTCGSINVNGRVAALLELGSGFNPEFTGRENVFLNAAVLGLAQEEIHQRFDAIAEFADIGDFIDQPVKTYSSGMGVRLAFSVAINVDPEILVVDEALSVGDELFQRKCFSRIEAIKKKGATILFVSHSGGTVVELCDRAILMNDGHLVAQGEPKQIVGNYQKLLYAPADKRATILHEIVSSSSARFSGTDSEQPAVQEHSSKGNDDASVQNTEEMYDPALKPESTIEYESHGALIEDPRILNMAGETVNNLVRGRVYRFVYTVKFERSISGVRFGMLIKTLAGVELGGGTSASSTRDSVSLVRTGESLAVEFSFGCALNPGTYFLNAGVQGLDNEGVETFLHRLIDIATFKVIPETRLLSTGVVDFGCRAIVSVNEVSTAEGVSDE